MALRPLFGKSVLAAAAVVSSLTTAQADDFDIPDYLQHFVTEPADNCIYRGQSDADTVNAERLKSLRDISVAGTDTGRYLIETVDEHLEFPFCFVDDPKNIGTSRLKMLGEYFRQFGTVSYNLSAYQSDIQSDPELMQLQAFAMLEEYAHALNAAALLYNFEINTNEFSPFLSVRDAIKKMWIDEALASTAAIIAARQKAENGDPAMWEVVQKFEIYQYVVQAVDEAAKENIDNLRNGAAHVRGVQAWLATQPLVNRAADKMIKGYSAQLDGFQQRGFPVVFQSFGAHQVVQMAAFLGSQEAFQGPSALGIRISFDRDTLFQFLPDEMKIRINELTQQAEVYKRSRATAPAITQ